MSCIPKNTRQDNAIASGNHVRGPSKDFRGLSSCQDPHISSLSVPSNQRIDENRHDLNVAKQVTVWSNLSCYWVFHCFLTPSFVFLDASGKSRCLIKLSHPSFCSADKWKQSFYLQNCQILATLSPIQAALFCGRGPLCDMEKQHHFWQFSLGSIKRLERVK